MPLVPPPEQVLLEQGDTSSTNMTLTTTVNNQTKPVPMTNDNQRQPPLLLRMDKNKRFPSLCNNQRLRPTKWPGPKQKREPNQQKECGMR
jgi:hypothetical protein